jgi:HPt (histidine-containing phosphotransfer) domain-containing protein
MKSTDPRLIRTDAEQLAEDALEQLQTEFHKRLGQDRVQFVVLSAALTRCAGNPAPVFEELATVAHRLRGASAIMGAVEIREAAHALELAAHNALAQHADEEDGKVWSTLIALTDRLAAVTDSNAADPVLSPSPRQRSKLSDCPTIPAPE